MQRPRDDLAIANRAHVLAQAQARAAAAATTARDSGDEPVDNTATRKAMAVLLAALAVATLVHFAPLASARTPKPSLDGSPGTMAILFVQGL